jgi:HAE1 family hydrophobic/amphiphilic exporter-1
MAVLIVLVLGTVSLSRLPIDLMPDITYPTLSVATIYENASPEEVEELVTRPIEEAMSAVPGVDEVTSVSVEGISQVRINFSWGTDLDAAANDIRDRLDRVIPRLPDDTERPMLRKFDLASFPILILGAASRLDPIQTRRIIDDQIKYRIERQPGVAAVDVFGGLDREIHVNILPDKIKALGLPLDQILNRIKAQNVNIPAGPLERGNLEVMIRTPGEYTGLDEVGNTVIAIREGVPIQLNEVANIKDSWQKLTRIVKINGKPGIRIAVNKQSGQNTVEVARGVLEEIRKINEDIPQVEVIPIIDTSDYIQRSIHNVGTSILYGGALAILVLLFFLRNIRSTAVIATAIPISVIATFALIYFGGFTLNLMTLGGLALGIGMLVDNAIVVLENIYRLRESGRPPHKAAVIGSEEVTAAIIASTLTTLVVFLPLIFVRGMSGVMFKQLAYVVSFALACSLAAALTLVPTLSSLVLHFKEPNPRRSSNLRERLYLATGRFFETVEQSYKKILRLCLTHPKLVILASILILLGSLFLVPLIGFELMPTTDEGEVRVYVEMEVGTRLDVLEKTFRGIEKTVAREVPEAKNTETFVGTSSWRPRGSHTGRMRISLKPQSERTRSSDEIASALRRKLMHIPGAVVRTRAGQGLFILRMGTGDADRIQIEIRGYDMDVARALALRIKTLVEDIKGVTDAQLSRDTGSPEEIIIVDRQKAAAMKVTVSQVADMLQTVLSGTAASYYREGGHEYRIRLKLQGAEQMAPQELLDLTLTNADGESVVLRNVVTVRPRTGPVIVERKDQERITTVSANIADRDMGSVMRDIREALHAIPVPKNFVILFGGDYEEQQKAARELSLSFILALILVYMVLASLYESLIDPLIVMFSVPLAAIGVILMLFLSHTTINVQSSIGCIMLGGIVVNNAILLVDHTNLLVKRDGMAVHDAIQEAGKRRLRPILMTASTTILALVPMAIGIGEGGEAQAPMARAVIGGLLSSSVITLILVPTLYASFKTSRQKKSVQSK